MTLFQVFSTSFPITQLSVNFTRKEIIITAKHYIFRKNEQNPQISIHDTNLNLSRMHLNSRTTDLFGTGALHIRREEGFPPLCSVTNHNQSQSSTQLRKRNSDKSFSTWIFEKRAWPHDTWNFFFLFFCSNCSAWSVTRRNTERRANYSVLKSPTLSRIQAFRCHSVWFRLFIFPLSFQSLANSRNNLNKLSKDFCLNYSIRKFYSAAFIFNKREFEKLSNRKLLQQQSMRKEIWLKNFSDTCLPHESRGYFLNSNNNALGRINAWTLVSRKSSTLERLCV